MKLIVGPTLLNSFDWCKECPPSWSEKALEDLTNTIKRKPFVATPEAEKGIEFETILQRICERGAHPAQGSGNFLKIVEACKGGMWQVWRDYFFSYENMPVRCFNKIDVLMRDRIIDIKTTGKYKGPAQYAKGWQPITMFLATDKPLFEFIIAEWESKDSKRIGAVHNVFVHKTGEEHARLLQQFGEFMEFLKTKNLYDAYLTIYCKNK